MDAEQVVEALAAGRVEAVHAGFSASFAQALPVNGVMRVWNGALEQLGAFRAADPPLVLYDFALRFERGGAHLQVVYQGAELTGLVLKPGAPTARFGE